MGKSSKKAKRLYRRERGATQSMKSWARETSEHGRGPSRDVATAWIRNKGMT
jgi:hypothetical protein